MQRRHRARLRVCLLLAGIAGLVLLPAAAASAHGDEEVGDMVFVDRLRDGARLRRAAEQRPAHPRRTTASP